MKKEKRKDIRPNLGRILGFTIEVGSLIGGIALQNAVDKAMLKAGYSHRKRVLVSCSLLAGTALAGHTVTQISDSITKKLMTTAQTIQPHVHTEINDKTQYNESLRVTNHPFTVHIDPDKSDEDDDIDEFDCDEEEYETEDDTCDIDCKTKKDVDVLSISKIVRALQQLKMEDENQLWATRHTCPDRRSSYLFNIMKENNTRKLAIYTIPTVDLNHFFHGKKVDVDLLLDIKFDMPVFDMVGQEDVLINVYDHEGKIYSGQLDIFADIDDIDLFRSDTTTLKGLYELWDVFEKNEEEVGDVSEDSD